MFRPRIGQQVLMAIALGLVLLPAVARAATVTVPLPFDTNSATVIPSSSDVNSLSISNDASAPPNTLYFGTLDMKNNDLIVQKANRADALAAYASVTDMTRSGYNGGDWLGTGVTSSTAAFDVSNGQSPGLTAIGVILNDAGDAVNPDGSGTPIYSTFDGRSVDQYAVLVKYTFLGDTDVSGYVDGFDIATVKTGRIQHLSGWVNGEFQYGGSVGGVVDGADIAFSKTAIIQQHNYPFAVTVAQTSALSVPEPASLSLILMAGIAGLGYLARRRATGAC